MEKHKEGRVFSQICSRQGGFAFRLSQLIEIPMVRSFVVVVLAGVMLGGCASGINLWPFGQGTQATDEKKSEGRIALVGADEVLAADPSFAGRVIILPDPVQTQAWAQAGGSAAKGGQHVDAAVDLRVAWRRKVAQGSTRKQPLSSGPVAADGKVFLLDSNQAVIAVSASDAKPVWRVQLASENRRDGRAFGGGVAFAAGDVFVTSGFGFVVALDANTGMEKWRRNLGHPLISAPSVRDGRVYVIANNNEIFALETATGATIWSDQGLVEPARIMSAPSAAVAEDVIVAPMSSGEVIAFFPSNGRRLWTDTLSREGRATPMSSINDIPAYPVVSGGLVYAASHSGVLAAIDLRRGERLWTLRFPSNQAPVVLGDHVFAVSTEGQVVAVDRLSGKIVWLSQLARYRNPNEAKGAILWSGPLLARNRVLLLSSTGELVSLDVQTGAVMTTVRINANIARAPIVLGDTVFVLSEAGELIAIR